MKLLTLHQRLIDIVKEADQDEKLSWADLVNIANHLVEAGVDIQGEALNARPVISGSAATRLVTLDDTEEGLACDCGCDEEVEGNPTWEEMSHWLSNVPPVRGSR